MSIPERIVPPLDTDERSCLASWLDFYRATLIGKCDGLDDDQVRLESAAPSSMTLLGLLQHMAEVERNWFRRVLAQEEAPPIYAPGPKQSPHDGGFDLDDDSTYDRALRVWTEEVSKARKNCADRALDATVAFMGGQVTLRWIYTHMIGEYARHCGHADLIRERVDGSTGI